MVAVQDTLWACEFLIGGTTTTDATNERSPARGMQLQLLQMQILNSLVSAADEWLYFRPSRLY